MTERKPRSDKGTKRVVYINPPRVVSFQLNLDDPVEKRIWKAIDDDKTRALKTNPKANVSKVLIDWLADYLGLKQE